MCASSLWATNYSIAITRMVGILVLIASFFALLYLSQSLSAVVFFKLLKKISILYLSVSFVYYLFGLYFVYFNGVSLGEERKLFGLYLEGILPRMRGFADSPNNLVLLLFPIFYSLIIEKKLNRKLLTLVLIAVVCTISFTGYLAFIVILICLFFTNLKPLVVKCFSLVAIAVLILLYLYITNEQLASIVTARINRLSSGSGRFDLFVHSINMVNESSMFGFGLGQARIYLLGFQGRDLQSTHNSFIEVFFEGGVIGLILFSLCWIAVIIYTYKVKILRKQKVIVLSYLLALFVLSLSNLMVYVELMVLNFFCLTMLLKYYLSINVQLKHRR